MMLIKMMQFRKKISKENSSTKVNKQKRMYRQRIVRNYHFDLFPNKPIVQEYKLHLESGPKKMTHMFCINMQH